MPAWPSIPRHCCQSGRSFRYRYASKFRSGSRWTRFDPLMRPLVMPATTLRDVDVAVLEVCELFVVAGRDGQREHGAVGEDGAGTASGAGIKALAADDQVFSVSRFYVRLSTVRQSSTERMPTSSDAPVLLECPSFVVYGPRARSTAFLVHGLPSGRLEAALRAIPFVKRCAGASQTL